MCVCVAFVCIYHIECSKKGYDAMIFEQIPERSEGHTLQALGKRVFQAERTAGAKISR